MSYSLGESRDRVVGNVARLGSFIYSFLRYTSFNMFALLVGGGGHFPERGRPASQPTNPLSSPRFVLLYLEILWHSFVSFPFLDLLAPVFSLDPLAE